MTRLPHENRDVTPLKGDMYPRYKVKATCAHPECARIVDHAHHIWRRSFIGGDYAWVRLWDGTVVGNLVGLCWRHHEEITVNKAAISWRDETGVFVWVDNIVVDPPQNSEEYRVEASVDVGKLSPQPPKWGSVTSHTDHGDESSELCPECNRPKRAPRPELPPGEKRRRKNWNVAVPDDQEDGATVLDVLVEEVAAQFGVDHYTSALKRYHVLVPALAYIVQNKVTIERG